jgi:hypothetical protein
LGQAFGLYDPARRLKAAAERSEPFGARAALIENDDRTRKLKQMESLEAAR